MDRDSDRSARDPRLAERLHLFRTMFERGSVGQLIVDFPSFRIDVVNAALCTMTGFSAADLVGKDIGVFFPAGQSPAADSRERLADRTADGYAVDRILQRRDGTPLPVLSTVAAVRDASGTPISLLVSLRNLTYQREVEGKQRRDQSLIDAAVTALPVSFSMFDTDLRLSYAAGGGQHIARSDPAHLGHQISELTDNPDTVLALEQALTGSESTSRTSINGHTYLDINAPMRDATGAIIGVVSVSSDISAEVAAETNRRRAEEMRLFAAAHDPLTGLIGRAALVRHLDDLTIRGTGAGALLLLDLDDFNLINVSLGHEVGDAVIVEVAKRVSDAFPGSLVAKYGGDEFAVVASFVVDATTAREAAGRVSAMLDREVNVGGHAVRVTASLGIAIDEHRTHTTSSTLIRNADSALSHAKGAGSGQCRLYDAAMRREVQERLAILEGLRAALSDGQFRVAYQPIVNLSDRSIVGAEALLRWIHPDRGSVPPAEFIPTAEHSGLIVPIGRWVMDTACAAIRSLHRDHGLYVSVNLSLRQLTGGGLAEWIEDVLNRTELPPDALIVEVTESAFMDDLASTRSAFHCLRTSGVRVAIDDFGTGYSSLARLQDVPVDVIKLDKAFVTGVDVSPDGRAMAAAILQLSRAIGATIIAEGIETEGEAATLQDLGYTTGQGYLFARAMRIADLTACVAVDPAGPARSA